MESMLTLANISLNKLLVIPAGKTRLYSCKHFICKSKNVIFLVKSYAGLLHITAYCGKEYFHDIHDP